MSLRAKMVIFTVFLALTAMCSSIAWSQAAVEEASKAYTCPEDLWLGYNPDALPFDIEVIKSWQEDGCWYEKFKFTGEITEDGFKTRILAVRGGPIGAKSVPGIVHLHGGGQTVSPQWVQYWAKRGYNALSFDFCGPAYDRTEYSDWGPLIHCNMIKPWGTYWPKAGVKNASWAHWIMAGRRALSVIVKTKGTNADKLGIFGCSVGGQLSWMVAGADPRVKAAVPFYGCGYLYDQRRGNWYAGVPSYDDTAFRHVLSAEANAPYIKGAVMFLSASNDMHGWMTTSYDTLGAVKGTVRQAFTPRYDHHVEPDVAKNLPLFMDWQLKNGKPLPKSPKVQVSLDENGVPLASVFTDKADEVSKVEVYYSLDERCPGSRFWRTVRPKASKRGWRISVPVMDAWKSVNVFANVYYTSGACLSSNHVNVLPGQLGKAKATLKWTDNLEDSEDVLDKWYYVPAYVDPNVNFTYLVGKNDPADGKYVMLNPECANGDDILCYVGTHSIGDEQYQGQPGKALAFDFKGGFKAELKVVVTYHDRMADFKKYTAPVQADSAKTAWQSVVLPVSAFKDEDGKVLESWKETDKLELVGNTSKRQPACFRNFRWVSEPAAKQ